MYFKACTEHTLGPVVCAFAVVPHRGAEWFKYFTKLHTQLFSGCGFFCAANF